MGNVSQIKDQNGEVVPVLGQPLQVPINLNLGGGGAVLQQLVPGRVYELSADGGVAFLFGDAGVVVTVATGRFSWMTTGYEFKVEPDAPYLSVIQLALGILPAATVATLVELR